MNDFSVEGAKIERLFGWGSKNWWKNNQDNQCIQKRYTQCTMGSEPKPQKLGNFREFCVKSNLTVCKFSCKCKLQKNWEQDVLVAPLIMLLVAPLFPRVLTA